MTLNSGRTRSVLLGGRLLADRVLLALLVQVVEIEGGHDVFLGEGEARQLAAFQIWPPGGGLALAEQDDGGQLPAHGRRANVVLMRQVRVAGHVQLAEAQVVQRVLGRQLGEHGRQVDAGGAPDRVEGNQPADAAVALQLLAQRGRVKVDHVVGPVVRRLRQHEKLQEADGRVQDAQPGVPVEEEQQICHLGVHARGGQVRHEPRHAQLAGSEQHDHSKEGEHLGLAEVQLAVARREEDGAEGRHQPQQQVAAREHQVYQVVRVQELPHLGPRHQRHGRAPTLNDPPIAVAEADGTAAHERFVGESGLQLQAPWDHATQTFALAPAPRSRVFA
uniref:Putative secreted protein n=1 Tax=Ixodes ricinus TaxID=34613 RepID=A0A147BU37_IXORI